MTILGSGADGARSGPGGVGLRGAQLPSPAQERSQEERAAECQMNKSVAHGEGPAGTAGEVESWNAIERTDVPERGVKRLEDLARGISALQQNLHRLLSREITREHNIMLLLGSMRAEERLAIFLLNLSQRYHERGYSSTEFVLRMTREEIGKLS